MKLPWGSVVGAVSLVFVLGRANVGYGVDDRPTKQDIADLTNHVRELPPRTYDIELLLEFSLKKISQAELRKWVTGVQEDIAKRTQLSAEQLKENIEFNFQLALDDHSRARKMRRHYFYSSQYGYRVETVTERLTGGPGIETGPIETAEIENIQVNVGRGPEENRSVRSNCRRKIADLFSKGQLEYEDAPWSGGTIGTLNWQLLKSALLIGLAGEQNQVDKLEQDTHPLLKLRVRRDIPLPDGSLGRQFLITAMDAKNSKAGVGTFDVPSDSFSPVWKVCVGPNVALEVLEAKDGIARVWMDYMNDPTFIGNPTKCTLVSHKTNMDIDPTLFAFEAPLGYRAIDHTVSPTKVTYPDGRVEFLEPQSSPKPSVASKPGSFRLGLIVGNIFIVMGGVLFFKVRRRKSRFPEGPIGSTARADTKVVGGH